MGTYLDAANRSSDLGKMGYRYLGMFRSQQQVDDYVAKNLLLRSAWPCTDERQADSRPCAAGRCGSRRPTGPTACGCSAAWRPGAAIARIEVDEQVLTGETLAD